MPTPTTRLRRVCWVNLVNGYSEQLGFVSDELFHLIERPTVQRIPERAAQFTGIADATQLLQDNTSVQLLCNLNNLSGRLVVNVTDNPALPGLYLLEMLELTSLLKASADSFIFLVDVVCPLSKFPYLSGVRMPDNHNVSSGVPVNPNKRLGYHLRSLFYRA